MFAPQGILLSLYDICGQDMFPDARTNKIRYNK